jgi:hypothetical protein
MFFPRSYFSECGREWNLTSEFPWQKGTAVKFIATIEIEVPDGIAAFMGPGNVAGSLAANLSGVMHGHYGPDSGQDVVSDYSVKVTDPGGGIHGLGWSQNAPEKSALDPDWGPGKPAAPRTRVVSKPAASSARKTVASPQKPAPARTAVVKGKGNAQPVRMGRPPFQRDANGEKISDGKGGFLREWEPGK